MVSNKDCIESATGSASVLERILSVTLLSPDSCRILRRLQDIPVLLHHIVEEVRREVSKIRIVAQELFGMLCQRIPPFRWFNISEVIDCEKSFQFRCLGSLTQLFLGPVV